MDEVLIEARDVSTRFGEKVVHDRVSFDICRGEVFGIAGGSGTGKSVLLRELTMLEQPSSGSIRVFGEQTVGMAETARGRLRRRIGVLFQDGALFSGLSVLENVGMPIRERRTGLSERLIDEIAAVKLAMVGLDARAGALLPRQLSGGMRKRAALARAMALDPELLFLDEPSSGLDPITADAFDGLVLRLKRSLGLTVVMVTHDMDSLWRVADRVLILGRSKALAVGTMEQMTASDDPYVQEFFNGPRGRGARDTAWNRK